MNTDTLKPHVFDVGADNFQAEVLQDSLKTPVLIDFWAPWCGPCKSLGPLLEKLADEYHGAFRLGKIDVDKNQELAGMFGIRSIPAVMLVKDGQIIDGFTGALPEGQLRQFLSRHIQPFDAAEAAEAAPIAADSLNDESPAHVIERLRKAIDAEPERSELKLDLAVALMRAGDISAATAELEALPANLAADSRAIKLRSQLDLAHSLEGSPSVESLRQRLADNAKDWEAHDLLGLYLLLNDAPEQGLEHWLQVLDQAPDWNDGLAKKRLLAAFNALDDVELISRYRRKMATLLF